nr:MAG TPA: hypothetical protein [Caudoviricetes sp.]
MKPVDVKILSSVPTCQSGGQQRMLSSDISMTCVG